MRGEQSNRDGGAWPPLAGMSRSRVRCQNLTPPALPYHPPRVIKSPQLTSRTAGWVDGFISWSPPPRPPLTAPFRSVSPTDHGVLGGPICDADRRLWSLLPRPDHVGGDLRRAMEVIALRGQKKAAIAPRRWV